jgi:hypothetical protein
MSFWNRVGSSATDPWLGLTSAFGGGVAWAVGLGPWGLAIAGGMYAAGAIVGGVFKDKDEDQASEPALPQLQKGTLQAQLVDNLGKFIADLRVLREGPKPDALVDPSIEALVAADNAYGVAVRVAAAVDGLDVALSRSGGSTNNQQIREAVQRMADRRNALLGKLQGTVDEVAEVYTELLELSAAVSSLDVGVGANDEVAKVNASLDSLRSTLAELEAQARRPG